MKTSNNCRLVVVLIMYFSSLEPLYTQNLENLSQHTMLGAGIELSPGKFRMGFMYGQLNKATKLDSTTLSLVPVAFDRTGMAVKIGYGTDKTFFEISALKASDKMGSALFDVSAQQGNPW